MGMRDANIVRGFNRRGKQGAMKKRHEGGEGSGGKGMGGVEKADVFPNDQLTLR